MLQSTWFAKAFGLAARARAEDGSQELEAGIIPPVSVSNLDGFNPEYSPLLETNPLISTLTPADEFVMATTPLFLVLAIGFVVLIGFGFLSLRKDWKFDQ